VGELTNALGRHILAEFHDCDTEILNNLEQVEQLMKDAAVKAGATIVQSVFHMFSPHGVSGVVVISESHLAIHTWPEYGYAAVDVFTCGDTVDPAEAAGYLADWFKAGRVETQDVPRGVIVGKGPVHHKPLTHHKPLPQKPVGEVAA
jgi:S-adenosylmethionine decarboxylase